MPLLTLQRFLTDVTTKYDGLGAGAVWPARSAFMDAVKSTALIPRMFTGEAGG